ncbi:hypothetical protein [Nocardia rhamnosiphila]|uniref:hypothetical protein n=1 Tax=Nocardia rhamnosiphila TaxID=426716 RepID=UPI000A419052|nr:hypothetical protein [Nocardia rhamnosiphila]
MTMRLTTARRTQDKDFAEVPTWPGKSLEDSIKEVRLSSRDAYALNGPEAAASSRLRQ